MIVRCGQYIFDLSQFQSSDLSRYPYCRLRCPWCGSRNVTEYVSDSDFPNTYDETHVFHCRDCGRIIAVILNLDKCEISEVLFCERTSEREGE